MSRDSRLVLLRALSLASARVALWLVVLIVVVVPVWQWCCACSEVEIDVLTGEISVLRTDIVYDNGDSLNPSVDIGQIEGAFVMGLGFMFTGADLLPACLLPALLASPNAAFAPSPWLTWFCFALACRAPDRRAGRPSDHQRHVGVQAAFGVSLVLRSAAPLGGSVKLSRLCSPRTFPLSST